MLMRIDLDMAKQDYSYLFVGIQCHPSHILRFIRNLKLNNPEVKISLLSDRDPNVFPSEIQDYIEEYIKWRFTSRMRRLPFVNRLINRCSSLFQMRKLAREKCFDIINIHYPYYYMCYVMGCFRKMTSAIVVSPWGSDVLRLEGRNRRRLLAKVFQKADFITSNPNGRIGKVLVGEMRIDPKKLHPLAWGSETIDYINNHLDQVTTEEAKKKLGLEDRYVITCGYNAFEEQRHERMIQSIREIKDQLPENLTLLFPVTYGYSYGTRKQEYVALLKERCQEYGLDAVFYEDYLSVEELFYLRRGTDMFIHIQTTDGGNSSLQEYVLCGKKVVHGAWMHYDYLAQFKPLFYFPVNDPDYLDEAILTAYHSAPINTPVEVLSHIRNRGWRAKMALWDDFFRSII